MAKAKSSNGKPPDSTRIDKLVADYIKIRDKKDEYKEEIAKCDEVMKELARHMLASLDESGVESARTDEGTVTATVRYSITAEDKDAFMKYVAKHGAYELLDRRPNLTACREFAEEHDTLPPGVKLSSMRTVNVRSPS